MVSVVNRRRVPRAKRVRRPGNHFDPPEVVVIPFEASRAELERRTQDEFGMSAQKFHELYQRGLLNTEHARVISLGMLADLVLQDDV